MGALYSAFTRTLRGLVPAPGGSGTTRFLREDSSFSLPYGTAEQTQYARLCALLDPGCVEPLGLGTFSYAVAANGLKYVLASWYTNLGSGRFEVRNPAKPYALSGATLTGLTSTSTAVTLDPSLATTPADPKGIYFGRLNTLETLPNHYQWFNAANQTVILIPGPYGAILTRYVVFDLDWLIIQPCATTGWNLGNELSDLSTKTQRQDNPLLMPVNKGVCSFALSGNGTAEGAPPVGGSITYKLLPPSWSLVADANTYAWRDDFWGSSDMPVTSLDLTKWTRTQSTVGNVDIEPLFQACKLFGNSSWSTNGIVGTTSFARSAQKKFVVDVSAAVTGSPSLMVGWSNGSSVDIANYAHALVFLQSGGLKVYENNNDRGAVGTTFSPACTYRVRITALSGGGATYEIQGGSQYQPIGGSAWTNVTPGTTTSATNTLYPALTAFSANNYASDARVI